MKKILLVFAALALSAPAFAQDIDLEELGDFNTIDLTWEGSRVETDLSFAFPMYFGWSTLADANAKGPWMLLNTPIPGSTFDTHKNFVYGLQLADMQIHYKHINVSVGLRWTFMDFAFANPGETFSKQYVNATWPDAWMPHAIVNDLPAYNGKKSKIHANYFGIPFRAGLQFGSSKVYVGASIEMLTGGYTKYKQPKNRITAKDLFNPIRATVEGGFSYGGLGVFVSYGLTPLFQESLSDAKTLTFGLLLGL